MQKLNEIHQHLLQELSPLGLRPESVKAFADEGDIVFYQSQDNQNFKMRYSATVALFDTTITAGQAAYVITQWLKDNLPHMEEPVKFNAEIVDTATWDIVFSIPIEEFVIAQDIDGAVRLARSQDANLQENIDATLSVQSIHDPNGQP